MPGVALSQITNVGPNLGQSYIIDCFMVVVFGGVGNLWGTLVGAMTLGVVNKFLEPFAGAVLGKIVVLVLIILFIQRRPRGLFPQGPAAEASPVEQAVTALSELAMQRWLRSPRLDRSCVGLAACWRSCWRPPSGADPEPGGAGIGLHMPTYPVTAAGQIPLLRAAGAGGRPGLGLSAASSASATAPSSRSAAMPWACT